MLVCYKFILAGESSWVLSELFTGLSRSLRTRVMFETFGVLPPAAKADFGGRAHRSGKPLRHPKAKGKIRESV
jgi:hypothetical protein